MAQSCLLRMENVCCDVREMCIFVRVTVHVCGASVSVLKGTG